MNDLFSFEEQRKRISKFICHLKNKGKLLVYLCCSTRNKSYIIVFQRTNGVLHFVLRFKGLQMKMTLPSAKIVLIMSVFSLISNMSITHKYSTDDTESIPYSWLILIHSYNQFLQKIICYFTLTLFSSKGKFIYL